MTAKADSLPAFFLARIDEDEAEVESRIAGELESLHRDGMPHWTREHLLTTRRDEAGVIQYDASWLTCRLAECDAKRRIAQAAKDYSPELAQGYSGEWAFDYVLRCLALLYADHPDYREEWRP